MAEHRAGRRRRLEKLQTTNKQRIVLIVIITLGLGYIAGTFNNQIVGTIAPLFGVKVYTGTLDLSSLQQTYQNLKAYYDGKIDDSKLIDGANRGLVDALGDQYTTYLNASDAKEFEDDLSGNIGGGIGAEISLRGDRTTIIRVLPDNPAIRAGLLAGDVIDTINDESTQGLTVEQAVSKIRGEEGTTVKLGILRDGSPLTVSVTRAVVNNPSVSTTIQGNLGIMTITRFDEQTGSLARTAAQDFVNKGVNRVIVDLRDNGGGYLSAAQDLASLWLNNQVVVSERAGGAEIASLKSGSDPIFGDAVKTAVLANGSSASASEIVAGALQDHKKATIVGEQTFGKGSVQKLINLDNGAELKVTIAKWYTPNGKNISKEGITPDKKAERTAEDSNAGRDPQLDAAKAVLGL